MFVDESSLKRSYVLTHLDVYNWGAFGGSHTAEFDLQGTAIIGPTGSGKTTLVDALMTLLTASPRYNLASTGGHESDRDLVSYVRGVSGAGNDSGLNEHVVRPAAVLTGLCARLSDGFSVVRLGALFWFDGSSSAPSDLKRRWFFSQADQPGLDEWLEAANSGGVRALKEMERVCEGLKMYESKTAYLARMREFFEVGENAFNLLNRAAGLKQLDSIDTVFRELVLDDKAVFSQAKSVAEEFDTLASIRSELETARVQRDLLRPIEKTWVARRELLDELEWRQRLHRSLPVWFATGAATLWDAQVGGLRAREHELADNLALLDTQLKSSIQLAGELHSAYLSAGGGTLRELESRAEIQAGLVSERTRRASAYQSVCGELGLDDSLSTAALQDNQRHAALLRADWSARYDELKDAAWRSGSMVSDLEEKIAAVEKDLQETKSRPGSNIPTEHQRFRSLLAVHLAVEDTVLPFFAELVEVKPDQRRWRGAIERAIGANRLRIMISAELTGTAMKWINQRDNKLHVMLREVKQEAHQSSFFEDGYARKLSFKPHPHREAVKQLLADIDRHCVDTVEQLRITQHAMTDQGLMSGRAGYFDKQDQRRLGDDWFTGFDNQDRLLSLQAELRGLNDSLQAAQAQFRVARGAAEDKQKELSRLEQIENTHFIDIDLPDAQARLRATVADIQRLKDPGSDLESARVRWQTQETQVELVRKEAVRREVELGVLGESINNALGQLERFRRRRGNGLDEQAMLLARQHLPEIIEAQLDQLDDLERNQTQSSQATIEGLLTKQRKIEGQLVREMEHAKKADTGALAETGTLIDDVPDYLTQLRVLVEEALPEKLQRFLQYLNQSSDQGVTQLLSTIDNEVSVIEERIDELNATLRRVDYQPGRYLQLEPQRVEHESLRTLQLARAHLRSAQLKDDHGESHYQALKHLIDLLREASDRRKTLSSLALLDPRYRLSFSVLVIDRVSGATIEKRTSSQGGSGGEKEIIASYVLTASLSYALCPAQSERPLFATIVLDEAFSKSSQAVAGRIIRALEEFGLHPLFVTPNKELRLLRTHTRSAILIHRRGSEATMTSISWEALAEHARGRGTSANEVAG
ncbi:hypothetical protein CNO08_07875 [Lysobacter capsici]|nr:hypothetical protein CNO08_07875 [Lysobacter capsici]